MVSESGALAGQIFCVSGERSEPERKKGGTEIVYELYGLTDEEIEIVEDALED
ncbi:hypothetical protein AB7C87_02610 [Natrarchaeobius sp. A-rgal3]|uniref:hypothetical protein n=1 Tax=Natrarchaeobius versutus TaxID=1679078 RepID=UPI00350F9C25